MPAATSNGALVPNSHTTRAPRSSKRKAPQAVEADIADSASSAMSSPSPPPTQDSTQPHPTASDPDTPMAKDSDLEGGILLDPSASDGDSFDMSSSASAASASPPPSPHRIRLSPSAIAFPSPTTPSDPSPLHPDPAIPYTHDAGHLLITAASPLPTAPTEAALASTARAAAQSLLNHLLTSCPITTSTSTPASSTSGVLMHLPPPTFPLPREKPVPTPKPPTKWEAFAAKKGIGKDKRKREGRVWDEKRGDWAPRWGRNAVGRGGEGGWLMEVDEKAEGKEEEGEGVRGLGRRERKERVRRNERAQRANERKARKGKKGGG